MQTSADNSGVLVRPPLLYLGGLVVALVLRWFWPMPVFSQTVAVSTGVAMLVLGVGLVIWGRRTMQAAGTNIDPMRPSTAIVTSGPFRFSRNPLYVGLTLLFTGLTTALETAWGVVLLIPLLLVMHFGVVLREERYLERTFGKSYRQYRARVRRYL